MPRDLNPDEELRLQCLKLAHKQLGPWKKYSLGKHSTTLMALATMYKVFCQEGFVEAKTIADNKIRPLPADLVKLVKKGDSKND